LNLLLIIGLVGCSNNTTRVIPQRTSEEVMELLLDNGFEIRFGSLIVSEGELIINEEGTCFTDVLSDEIKECRTLTRISNAGTQIYIVNYERTILITYFFLGATDHVISFGNRISVHYGDYHYLHFNNELESIMVFRRGSETERWSCNWEECEGYQMEVYYMLREILDTMLIELELNEEVLKQAIYNHFITEGYVVFIRLLSELIE
jgi:hypothetical protein